MKNKFLYKVANGLYEKFGQKNELSEIVIITPSSQTQFFLNKYFSEFADKKPIWSPKYMKITQLFEKLSDIQLLDGTIQQITLIWKLYNEYKNIVEGNVETFDEFYSFGEILLNDFNEIDKYLVNTEYIFKNLNELKTMTDYSFLSEEQIEVLQRFMNFDETKLTQDFSNVWNNLKKVYDNFTQKIKLQKIGYGGLIMREIAENIDKYDNRFTAKKYAFVGFNSFCDAEKILLNYLNNNEKALFYWDNCQYLNEEKMKEFNWIVNYYQNELNEKEILSIPEIEFAEAVNSASQVGLIPDFLKDKKDAAIVLCDEKLLQPVLNVIPNDANIAILTTAAQSQIANQLIDFMKNSTAKNSKKLLEELLEWVRKNEKNKNQSNFDIAVIFEIKKMLNSLTKIIEFIDKTENLIKIIRRILFTIKIPYTGNKTANLQIMAMPNTRNMDFDNILMLSVNEGLIPKSSTENSFIPQSIRKAFGLPTIQMQDFQEQYNFFRLIQRAKKVSFVYNSGKSGTSKGEKSRFLMQLEYNSHFGNIKKIKLDSGEIEISENTNKEIKIKKEEWMLDKLKEKYNGKTSIIENGKEKINLLSPSAFNCYIDCPLQFYFKYIAGIKNDTKNELNHAALGNIFHKTMELIYKKEKSQQISPEFFDKYIQKEIAEETKVLIEKAFAEEGFDKEINTGEGLIIFKVISKMLKNMLEYDKRHVPFEIIGLEDTYYFEKDGIFVGGIIDRIDKKDDKIRIIDYKTGGRTKIENYKFQTYLYSRALSTKFNSNKISSELLFVLEFPIKEEIADITKNEEFEKKFDTKLSELFNIDIEFTQCENENICKYCDYSGICGK